MSLNIFIWHSFCLSISDLSDIALISAISDLQTISQSHHKSCFNIKTFSGKQFSLSVALHLTQFLSLYIRSVQYQISSISDLCNIRSAKPSLSPITSHVSILKPFRENNFLCQSVASSIWHSPCLTHVYELIQYQILTLCNSGAETSFLQPFSRKQFSLSVASPSDTVFVSQYQISATSDLRTIFQSHHKSCFNIKTFFKKTIFSVSCTPSDTVFVPQYQISATSDLLNHLISPSHHNSLQY